MCTVMLGVGAALAAASAVASSAAQSQANSARSGVASAERERQRLFSSRADDINDKSRGRYDNFAQGQDAKAKELGEFYGKQQQPLPESGTTTGQLPPTSSNILVQEGNKQLGKVDAFNNQQNTALGNLRAFSDVLGGISRDQSRDVGELNTIGSFRRGSSALVPMELENANSAGAGMQLFGDVLGGAGKVATTAGVSGAKMPDLFGSGSKFTPSFVPGAAGSPFGVI